MVFLGGGVGSCLRYAIAKILYTELQPSFPLGTFVVNILGCAAIGLFIGWIDRYQLHPNLGLLLTTGFCGGFTTFSTFMFENVSYVKSSEYQLAILYTFMSLTWGFAATFLAMLWAKNV